MGFFDNIVLNKQTEPKVVEEEPQVEQPKQENTPVVQDESVQQFNALKNATTGEMVTALKNKEILNIFETDDDVKKEITESAKQDIHDNIDINKQDTKNKKAKKKFEGNKEACKIYGVEDTVPLWQQALMSVGSAFWFIIYFIVATVTIAPISTFTMKLNTIFKKMWVSIVLAVVIYVAVVLTLPILMSILGK